jgi:hypothetical protein
LSKYKEAVKFNDFNPLPSFETSSIRVSWRKPGLYRASPSLRDFPFPLRLFRESGLTAAFLFPQNHFIRIPEQLGAILHLIVVPREFDGNSYGD